MAANRKKGSDRLGLGLSAHHGQQFLRFGLEFGFFFLPFGRCRSDSCLSLLVSVSVSLLRKHVMLQALRASAAIYLTSYPTFQLPTNTHPKPQEANTFCNRGSVCRSRRVTTPESRLSMYLAFCYCLGRSRVCPRLQIAEKLWAQKASTHESLES